MSLRIGDVVNIKVDRPLGSTHPIHKDIIYKVNYGFIEGVFSPDGEEQDAYILGVNEPLTQFSGQIVAIIRRLNDIEDKLVVAPIGKKYSKDEIKGFVDFQEKFFNTEIEI